ncbi:hypothetical protein KA005_81315 [bacterium]|nr:hypothetical protein [bacterium]
MNPQEVGTVKRGRGRPRKNDVNRATEVSGRPDVRVPVSGNRDILTIAGKDPAFEYRFVLDNSEDGQRIQKFKAAWWDLVNGSDGQHIVGQNMVYKTNNVGSIIRVPAGNSQFYYCMRIPKEYYKQDQTQKQNEITEREKAITQTDSDNGQYGNIKLSRD